MLAAKELPVTKRVSKSADPYVLIYLDDCATQLAMMQEGDEAGAAALGGYLGRTETRWGERWPKWAGVLGGEAVAANALHVDSETGVPMKSGNVAGPGGTAHAFVLHHVRDARCRLRCVLMDAADKGGKLGQDVPLGSATVPLLPLRHQVSERVPRRGGRLGCK